MIDRHHPLFTRNHWTATKEAKALRGMYLFPTEREVHQELHQVCPPVPLLGYYALSTILKEVNPIKEPQHDLDELTRAIETTTRHYKTHPIERELADLSIEALRLQLPFLINRNATIIDLKKGA